MAANPLTKGLGPVHPGEYLKEFIIPALDITTQGFAEHLGIGRRTLYDIMDGKKSVTANMALRLARATGVRAEMWMNLQALYELKKAEEEHGEELAKIGKLKMKPVSPAAG